MMEHNDTKFFIAAPFGNYISHRNAISVAGTYTLLPRGSRVLAVARTLRYSRQDRGWTNRLGLPNPGIEVGLTKIKQNQVLSIAEVNRNDAISLYKIIPSTQSLEINLSCPNLNKTLPWDHIHLFTQSKSRKWCIAKVSPHTRPEEIEYIIQAGYKTLHFSNTLPIEKGGLSGPAIKPYTKRLIRLIREEPQWKNIEIIAGGGVQTQDDVLEYMDEGAAHVSIGSVWFTPWRALKLFE